VASDPEALLRSIERTREELAYTVDTIAGRLDPKRVARRGVDAVRDSVTSVIEGARVKMHLDAVDGTAGDEAYDVDDDDASDAPLPYTAKDRAKAAVTAGWAQVAPLAKQLPGHAKRLPEQAKKLPPAASGGLAAFAALAAIVALRRRRG
jgi:hypothetical protein